jgi:hypothetical protein
MENGFEDWNLYAGNFNSKIAILELKFPAYICKYDSSSFLFGSFRANALKHVHEATYFAKSHFKKEKSSHVILFGRFLIPEWVSIRVIELDPDRIVTHSLKWNEFI